MSISEEPVRPGPRRLAWIAGAALVLVAAVAGAVYLANRGDDRPSATPTAPATTTSPSLATLDDPHGREACRLNTAASEQQKLTDAATVRAIVAEGSQSSSFEVQFQAKMLSDRFDIAAHASSDDLPAILAVQTASIEMQTACVKAGYR